MRRARGKVVKGRIVTRAKFPEGTKVIITVDDVDAELEELLRDEDELRAAIRAGVEDGLKPLKQVTDILKTFYEKVSETARILERRRNAP